MPLTRLRRGAFVVPLTTLLIAGGAFLSAPPAAAAPLGTLSVTSPTSGTVLTSRSVDVVGVGTDGAAIAVVAEGSDGSITVLGSTIVAGGQFTIPVVFTANAVTDQVLQVTQIPGGGSIADADLQSVPVTLPAPSPATPSGVIGITSPQSGSTATSRTVVFTGTAPVGSVITVATDQGDLVDVTAPVVVDGSGSFTYPVLFGPEVTSPVTVTFSGSDPNGALLADVPVTLSLPAPAPAPVITAPTMTTIVGAAVTFSGTGVAGQSVLVVAAPADAATAQTASGLALTDLAQTVTVDLQGNWTATFTLVLGSFEAVAIHVDPATGFPLSLPSNVLAVTLVEPTVMPASSSTGPMLAETGAEDAGFVGPAALLLLVGAALVTVARRRALRVPRGEALPR